MNRPPLVSFRDGFTGEFDVSFNLLMMMLSALSRKIKEHCPLCSSFPKCFCVTYKEHCQKLIAKLIFVRFRHLFPHICVLCIAQSLYEEDRIRCHRNPDLFRTSALPENIWRNRYQGIDANEATRVKLKRVPPGESNFINANHIPGDPPEKGGYIATQAPVCETMGHFWQMVHEQRVCVILMLTREREDRYDNLSERYWPKTGRKISFEGVEVFGMGKKSHKDVGIWERSFVVRLVGDDVVEEEDVKVVQLQFMSWPDHAIPASTECLLTLRKMVRKFSWDTGFNEDGDLTGRPIVVHCSAGIGRTGTYIAVDIALHRIEIALKEGADLDHDALRLDAIRDIVRYLKAQRSRMVQNPQQYRYIFDCVLDGTRELASGMSR